MPVNFMLREGAVGFSLICLDSAMGDSAIIDCSVLTTSQLLVPFP